MSQEKLSEKANIDRSYISMLENGRSGLSVETLFEIADAMGVSPQEIIGELEVEWRKATGRKPNRP